jgi:hypothetical protein
MAIAVAFLAIKHQTDSLNASVALLKAYSGAHLPPVPVTIADGRRVRLDDLVAGRDRLIVVFVRRGCPRCETVLGELGAQKPMADPMAAVAVVEVGADTLTHRIDTTGLPWVTALDTANAYETAVGGRVVPVMMVLDREGVVRAVYVGEAEAFTGLEWVKPQWAKLPSAWLD